MGILILVLSILLGTILFLTLKLMKRFYVCGFIDNLIMWLLCCIAAFLIILLFGRLLRGILFIMVIILIGYLLILCFSN